MGEGRESQTNPARTYATTVGGGLILLGLTGFFYSSSFATGHGLTAEKAFGLFYVNSWQNALHLLAGAIGLALAVRAPRLYCLGSGLVWIVLSIGGFFGSHGGEDIPAMAGHIPAGTANNLLNLALAGLAFAALVAAAPARSTSSANPRKGQRKPKHVGKKPPKQAEKALDSKPQLKPEERAGVGRPRSASRVTRPSRGPIN